jgi:hypothetical protein
MYSLPFVNLEFANKDKLKLKYNDKLKLKLIIFVTSRMCYFCSFFKSIIWPFLF